MRKFFDFFMDPKFSESFQGFFYTNFGESGAIFLLGTIKMLMIAIGSFILVAPFLPIIYVAAKNFLGVENFIEDETELITEENGPRNRKAS